MKLTQKKNNKLVTSDEISLPISTHSTVAVSAEEVRRLQRRLKAKDVLVCMQDVVFAMPHRGSQYSPLIVDTNDMVRVHRQYAKHINSKWLAKQYANGKIPNHHWPMDQKCKISILQRHATNRQIANLEELKNAIEIMINKNMFFGDDNKKLEVVNDIWHSSTDEEFFQTVKKAANSCILVVPHGADIINAMHLRPGALLIELSPARYHWPRLQASIEQMGVYTETVWFEETEETLSIANSTVEFLSRDNSARNALLLDVPEFTVDVGKVVGVIQNYLLRRVEKSVFSSYFVAPPKETSGWLRTKSQQQQFTSRVASNVQRQRKNRD
eukprot:CAMPEP_0113852240 /NCGR_PEP_ID=MMETSP0372-20130328/5327_1 /TAXON_ID=340204 /ORGANISM="Lankesteria abbotti" /LENGTH=326 /DNA_ID=CAMNT_0000823621 /DNA_START=5 /DNA_END=985 /DNA_ORIENTATION=+ /assembly_acc=CAM_ASM_000359